MKAVGLVRPTLWDNCTDGEKQIQSVATTNDEKENTGIT